MVLHRHSNDYGSFAKSSEFNPDSLRERVEQQHRTIIDDLRSGALNSKIVEAIESVKRAGGIQVNLLNPKSWLSGGNVALDLEILRRPDKRPEAGAQVTVAIEGASNAVGREGNTDERGRARIEFPMPALGKGDLTLVIRAQSDFGKDELRFAVRARPKVPTPSSVS